MYFRTVISHLKLSFQNTTFIKKIYLNVKYNPIFLFFYKKKVNSSNNLQSTEVENRRILIPLIETNHDQGFVINSIALALKARGHTVHLLLCDSCLDACEIKNSRNEGANACYKCEFKRKRIYEKSNLTVYRLSEVLTEEEKSEINRTVNKTSLSKDSLVYQNKNISSVLNQSVTRYFYGSSGKTKIQNESLLKKNLHTYIYNFSVMEKLNNEFNYDIVLNNMAVYSTWQPFFDFAKKSNIREVTINHTIYNPLAVVLNQKELFFSKDRYQKYLNFNKRSALTHQQNKVLDRFMANRFAGIGQPEFLTLSSKREHSSIVCKLKIDQSKKNYFLFSNLIWDIGLADQNVTFKSYLEWVFSTIEALKNNPSINLYIKPHPAESFDLTALTELGVLDFIKEKYPTLPKNVYLIDPELKINSYDLFKFIDLGLIFSGTLGLEMLLNKIPIINVARAAYNEIPSVSSPKNQTEYVKLLLESKHRNPDINDVRMFSYFYFIKARLPFNLTNKVFGLNFKKYNFNNLSDLEHGKNKSLDHLTACIINPDINPESY